MLHQMQANAIKPDQRSGSLSNLPVLPGIPACLAPWPLTLNAETNANDKTTAGADDCKNEDVIGNAGTRHETHVVSSY